MNEESTATGPDGDSSSDVVVVFADVGQGDCTIVIDQQSGQAMLVDCPVGHESDAVAILEQYGATLHTAAVTHFDSDHSVGAVAVMQELGAERFLLKPVPFETEYVSGQYRQLLAAVRKTGMELVEAFKGNSESLGRYSWSVIGPSVVLQTEAATRTARDRNRTSVVIRIDVLPSVAGGVKRSALLAGDCDRAAWLDLLTRSEALQADLFRWPHHGSPIDGQGSSRTGTLLVDEVLDAVGPDVVYMGIGTGNSHGHPKTSAVHAVRDRPTVTHYCSQVTPVCTSGPLTGPTPCAGDLTVVVAGDGTLSYDRGQGTQEAFVTGWTQPQCIFQEPAAEPGSGGALGPVAPSV